MHLRRIARTFPTVHQPSLLTFWLLHTVYGEYRTGKTQLAHTMCVIAQLPKEMGGASGKVAYIDTEGKSDPKGVPVREVLTGLWLIIGTFRPERIGQIADRFGLESGPVLENIVHGSSTTSERLAD